MEIINTELFPRVFPDQTISAFSLTAVGKVLSLDESKIKLGL